jgi:hypothetical protein
LVFFITDWNGEILGAARACFARHLQSPGNVVINSSILKHKPFNILSVVYKRVDQGEVTELFFFLFPIRFGFNYTFWFCLLFDPFRTFSRSVNVFSILMLTAVMVAPTLQADNNITTNNNNSTERKYPKQVNSKVSRLVC